MSDEYTPTTDEVCDLCRGGADLLRSVQKTDNLALCTGHWNNWLAFLSPLNPEPPCAAHLMGGAR